MGRGEPCANGAAEGQSDENNGAEDPLRTLQC
jgi:hypothetical protein